MYDGAELGRLLAANPDNTEAALAEYEQDMFQRLCLTRYGLRNPRMRVPVQIHPPR